MAKEAEDFLAHHGVLGMKWGQHKVQFRETESGNVTAKKYPIAASHDHVNTRELKRRPASSLSNAELKKVNERLQLERNHQQLNPNTVAKGKKALLGTVAALGVGVTLYGHINSKAGKATIALGKKAYQKLGVKLAETVMSTL